jgi:uncharacterized protein
MKRLLAIDGGGIRGRLPALFLAALEAAAGRPAASLFDLMSGTSTGGIIAVGLFAGLAAKAIDGFYVDKGPSIFPTALHALRYARLIDRPLYDAEPLEAALAELLGDARLSRDCGAELVVPAYCSTIPDAFLFLSAEARHDPGYDFALRDVARATSAAPVYFPKAAALNAKGANFEFVDGGIFANNPAICAMDEADRLWPGEDLVVVSIGTGNHTAPFDLGNGGAIDIGLVLTNMMMDASAAVMGRLARSRLGVKYRRYEIDLAVPLGNAGPVNPAMDDASTANLARLELLADKLVEGADIAMLAEELTA